MEKKNPNNPNPAQETGKSKYAGMSADEVLAQALGTSPEAAPKSPLANTAALAKAVPMPPKMKPEPPKAPAPLPTPVAPEREVKLAEKEIPPVVPVQGMVHKDTTNLILVNELFQHRDPDIATFHINGRAIEITLNNDFDAIVKAIGMAANLIMESGDNYIFSPNQEIIGTLVFLREVTNLNLEFLTKPEIRFSQLIETYDILMPLIRHLETLEDDTFQYCRGWYNKQLTASIEAATQYQHSAKGIVDALAEHNIKNQELMTKQTAELDDNKMAMVLDFIQRTEPQK